MMKCENSCLNSLWQTTSFLCKKKIKPIPLPRSRYGDNLERGLLHDELGNCPFGEKKKLWKSCQFTWAG